MPEKIAAKDFVFRHLHEIERGNASHKLGLYAVAALRLPMLKRDLVSAGTVTLGAMVNLYRDAGVDVPYPNYINAFMSKGFVHERGMWQSFLYAIDWR